MKRSTRVERRRTRWTAAEARAVLAELAASGLPLAEFGRERGLHPVRLSRWRRRLATIPSSAALVPVTVSGARAIRVGNAGVVVETPSMRVEIHDHERVAAAWVAELVRLTETRP
jgi:hypothetical protein